ncbi:hypothetical membrane protein [Xanthomonas albilineans GPE PC73]|uniref:Hypothetical membrane protein n=1 Tax=Xanthomonas albilineans (strain GPE PC73 / CFBP 7063) TaxID=380358 RepID=D2U906_XANAP|nr:putative membrane protein [Xanthomonas albilineans]CBA16607.1 hypothetical membrane protein [Xanthomonas albilineans GPE PC73]
MTLSAQAEVALFLRGLKWLAGVVGVLWGGWWLAPILTPMTLALPSLCGILLALPAVGNARLHDLHAPYRQSALYAGEKSTLLELPSHSPAQP